MEFYIGLMMFTLYGMFFGSFINAFEYRTKNNLSQKGRSYCPTCKHQIKFYHNIPILSYLLLKGQCKYCGTKISKQYVIVETLTTIFFIIAYLINYKMQVFTILPEYIIYISFLFSSAYISVYDFKYKEIPTNGYIGLIMLSGLTLFYSEYSLIMNIIFFFSWATFFYVVDFLYNLYYKYKNKTTEGIETIGGGDIKMSFFLGLIMQQYVFLGIILSYFLGGIYALFYKIFNKDSEPEIAFGPMMLLSTLLILFFNEKIYNIIF